MPDGDRAGKAAEPDRFGAFLSRCPDAAAKTGPLAGLRLAVKDNIAVKGQPFTAGLPLFEDRIASTDAAAVNSLLQAGASFVGMTRTDAAGFGVTTPGVVNPLLPKRIAGGSSGGAAVAVAANLADIGLGTDTGGSVRIPAACCGILGFKPTHGRISIQGVFPLAPSLDTVGLMARELAPVERAAAVLLDEPEAGRPAPAALRLGIDRARLERCDAAVIVAMESAFERLKRAGMTFTPITLPDRAAATAAHATIVLHEASAFYEEWRAVEDKLPRLVGRSLLAAQNLLPADVAAAQSARQAFIETFERSVAGVDAIILPTLPVPPPPIGLRRMVLEGREQSVVSILVGETCLANLTGGPALSLPAGGPPDTAASLQLLGRHGGDMDLLGIGRRVADALGG